jgi:DNA polymerase-3 subunit delta
VAPSASADDPLAALERAPLRPYWLVYGDETFLVDRALAVLRRRLDPDARPGTWRTAWADDDSGQLAAALDDLSAPLLFGGAPIVVIRRAEALTAALEERILELLPSLGTGGRLILVARALDQRRKLLVACAKDGGGVPCLRVTEAMIARRWLTRLAKERGHELRSAAADALIERTGLDLAQLAGDLEKVSLYAGEGAALDASHVEQTVAATRAHAIDELTDRLARGDLAGASRSLRALLSEGEPPIKIAAFLASSLRRALHVAELADAGLGPEDIAGRIGMPAWMVRKNMGRASATSLEGALTALRKLDLELKSSRPAAAVFEAALFDIVGARGRTATRSRS